MQFTYWIAGMLANSFVEFDEETHTYSVGGIVVPSVTQILGAMGCTKVWPGMSQYGERGRNVHRAIELLEQGRLDEKGEHERDGRRRFPIMPYVKQWKLVRDKYGIVILDSEQVVFHAGLVYAGRYDAKVVVQYYGEERCIGDIKSQVRLVAPGAAARLQAAGYVEAEDDVPRESPRYAITISPDAGDCVQYEGDKDALDWLAMARSYNWKKEHRLLEKQRR